MGLVFCDTENEAWGLLFLCFPNWMGTPLKANQKRRERPLDQVPLEQQDFLGAGENARRRDLAMGTDRERE